MHFVSVKLLDLVSASENLDFRHVQQKGEARVLVCRLESVGLSLCLVSTVQGSLLTHLADILALAPPFLAQQALSL